MLLGIFALVDVKKRQKLVCFQETGMLADHTFQLNYGKILTVVLGIVQGLVKLLDRLMGQFF